MNEVLFMYDNTTNRVKISDLTFCELAVEKDKVVAAGQLLNDVLELLKPTGSTRNQLQIGGITSLLNGLQLTGSYVDPIGNVVQQYASTNSIATVVQNANGTSQSQTIVLTQNNGGTTSNSVIAISSTITTG